MEIAKGGFGNLTEQEASKLHARTGTECEALISSGPCCG